MKAKIEKVVVWYDVKFGQARTVFQVYYSNHTIKRYYNSDTQHIPATVDSFVDSHTAVKLNSQCIVYVK